MNDAFEKLNIVTSMMHKKQATLQGMQKQPFRNRKEIKRVKTQLQALGEAQRDILNTTITHSSSTTGEVDKNNFATYEKMVNGAYEMYNNSCDYGGDIFGGIVDMRVSFIAGEGLSITAEDKNTEEWINSFIEANKLNGSRLLAMVLTGELEGKDLVILSTDAKRRQIKARSFSWYQNRYTVEVDALDSDTIKKITYKSKNENQTEEKIDAARAVFVKIGGTECQGNITDTPSRMHKILTDCENASRAKFDLRKNTHVFGKYMPYWKTDKEDTIGPKAILADIQAKSWEIGDGYAGPADFKLVEPSGAASDAIIKDHLLALRYISTMSGVPIHWMAWPELMSNRATAENMLEMVNGATRAERLIWEEAFAEIIEKARELAIDSGYADNSILGNFTVKLPLISMAMLQQLIDVWKPLQDSNVISKATFMNMLPGVNPQKEKEQIEREKQEAAKNSPIQNKTVQDTIDRLKNGAPDNGQKGLYGKEVY